MKFLFSFLICSFFYLWSPTVTFAKAQDWNIYPYRACFKGTIKNIWYDKQENSWITKVFVEEVFLKDQMFDAQKGSNKEGVVKPYHYANLEVNRTYQVRSWESMQALLKMSSKQAIGKSFLWSANTDFLNNEIELRDGCEIVEFSSLSAAELASIRNQISGTAEKWFEVKKYIQKELEKQWSPRRLIELTKHLDARCDPSTQSWVGPHTLSGNLYPKQEKELGKVWWYAVFTSKLKLDGVQLFVDKGNDTWRLWPSIGEPAPGKDAELSEILNLIGQNACRTYLVVNKKDYETISFPSVRKLVHRSDGSTLVEYKLESGKTLTLDLSPNFQMSNIKLDGKPNALWSKVFADRFKNLDAVVNRYR